jgi:hypothetical protein
VPTDAGSSQALQRFLKPVSLAACVALSGLTLLAWTMVWFTVTLGETSANGDVASSIIEVSGDTAVPVLPALSLAGLALTAALAIAGRVLRVILGILLALIGCGVALSAFGALSSPITTSAPLVTEATGVTGSASVHALVSSVSISAWPAATTFLGVLTLVLGIIIVVSAGRWPGSSRKYETGQATDVDRPRSAVSDWDSLSDGSDPTSR